MGNRIISWFSCGAASAVATKLALSTEKEIIIAYCEVKNEHEDNKRFLKDCEKWFGQEIIILGNDKYNRDIYEVFHRSRFLVGPSGAKCTGVLKKEVRQAFELSGDRQILGYTVEEEHRVNRFIDANNDVDIWPILVEKGLSKQDCLAIVVNAGIELPTMYKLGYHNNNCIGCVKGQAGYFNKIRVDFPRVFRKLNRTEIKLGRSVCKIDMQSVKNNYPKIYKSLGSPETKNEKGGSVYWRPQLHELPPDAGDYPNEISTQCGIFCHLAEDDINQGLGIR